VPSMSINMVRITAQLNGVWVVMGEYWLVARKLLTVEIIHKQGKS
jgi:hypothetical protein